MNSEHAIAFLCLMKGSQTVDAAGDRLRIELFHDKDARRVVAWVLSEVEEGRFVELTHIKNEALAESARIIATSDSIAVSLAHLDFHLAELEDQDKRHTLDKIAKKIEDRLLQADPESLRAEIMDDLQSEVGSDSGGTVDAKEAALAAMNEIEEMAKAKNGILGFSTGFKQLNRLTQGQMRKKLWIIAGRPGHAKSLISQMFADAAMKRSNAKVMIFSMEMPTSEWMQRWIMGYSGVSLISAIHKNLRSDLQRMQDAAGVVSRLPVSICDKGGLTRSNLARRIRRASRNGFNYFIIDHLGLMNLPAKDRRLAYGDVSKMLKVMAKELDVHITVLIQLNRDAEQAFERQQQLTLRHLSEADQPGQDCDVCLMMDFWNREEPKFHVVKNRGGKAGDTIGLHHNGACYLLREIEYAPAV